MRASYAASHTTSNSFMEASNHSSWPRGNEAMLASKRWAKGFPSDKKQRSSMLLTLLNDARCAFFFVNWTRGNLSETFFTCTQHNSKKFTGLDRDWKKIALIFSPIELSLDPPQPVNHPSKIGSCRIRIKCDGINLNAPEPKTVSIHAKLAPDSKI